MNKLLNKIFEDVIAKEDNVITADKTLDIEVKKLVEPYKNHFSKADLEIIKELMYAILLKSECVGFKIGIHYTIKVLIETMMDL